MSITVLFFGATADIVRRRELRLEQNESTASRLLEELVSNHPALASHKLLISINQQYASCNDLVRDGDEVAIFTAVSGG
jgi:molybdopterin synthase sulfur carrier subunit